MLFKNDDPPVKRKRAVVLAESPISTDGSFREDAFIKEAENVRKFYKNNPDVDVQIMPFYGDKEFNSIKSQLGKLSDDDEVYVFGHGGSTLGGIPHETIAGTLKESGAKNCYMGSCNFEDYAEPYKQIQNFMYKPDSAWWGFNPSSKTPIEGMFSRATDYEKSGFGKKEAMLVNPEKGVHYNKTLNRPIENPLPVPKRSFKELF